MSRDPRRIPKVLDAIKKEWGKHPELRFGQWFYNLVQEDGFYLEDEDLILLITKKYQKKK